MFFSSFFGLVQAKNFREKNHGKNHITTSKFDAKYSANIVKKRGKLLKRHLNFLQKWYDSQIFPKTQLLKMDLQNFTREDCRSQGPGV